MLHADGSLFGMLDPASALTFDRAAVLVLRAGKACVGGAISTERAKKPHGTKGTQRTRVNVRYRALPPR